MHDLVIRGGHVVDGTGQDRTRADIAISGGRIVKIGDVKDSAAASIEADGQVIAPGFIDVHTHLDVQAFWDPTLSPSPLHGVTTVVGGNCGFSVAPLDDTAGPYLMRMLSRVEGMPLESLESGVPWDWRTTADYLNRLPQKLAVNAGFMVGHSAIRRVVMGDEATKRASTVEELDAMKSLLRAGIEAGGFGFSSTWAESHNDAEGRPVPSRFATADELVALSRVAGEFAGTSLEFLPVVPARGGFPDEIVELMANMSAAAKRPLNWNVLQVTAATLDDAMAKLAASDVARARGGRVVGLTIPGTIPARFSFLAGFGLDLVPGLHDFCFQPPSERLAILRDPVRRAEWRRAAEVPSAFSHLVDWPSRQIVETFSAETRAFAGRSVEAIASEQHRDPFDVFIDIVVADELKTTFSNPSYTATHADWLARAEVWRDGRAVIGASDAGAHLDMVETFSYATLLLQEAVREQEVLTLEEAVQLVTEVPARLYGLKDRGVLRPGAHADVVIFDPRSISRRPVVTRFDLPGGAGRLYGEADGISKVLVAGHEIVHDGAFTGDLPGRVLRSGRDTYTPEMS